jgi:hypothetical protein
MNDDATDTALKSRLDDVRDSLGDVHMTVPASEIFAGASRRRARRGIAAVAAGCAAIAVALAVALPAGNHTNAVHVHLAAWSVDTSPNGTVTFKLRNTSQPRRLEHVLAEAGVPAMIRWGEVCLAQGRHVLLPTRGIVSYLNGRPTQLSSVFILFKSRNDNKPLNWSWTITPSKIPANARFVISAIPSSRVAPNHVLAEWEFIPADTPVNCAPSIEQP